MIAQIDQAYIRTRPLKALFRLFVYAFIEGRPLTTRGRWINPLVFAEFTVLKHLPQLKSVSRPIYVLGTGRNGSTLLGKVLSLHPSICFLNEPKALWHSIHSQADVIGNYSNLSGRFQLQANDASQDACKSFYRLYAFALRASASDRLLDKNGEAIFRVEFIKKIFPDAQFLFLIRNGRDVVTSVNQWSRSHGVTNQEGVVQDWWGKDRRKWEIMVDELVSADGELLPLISDIQGFQSQRDMAAVEWILTAKKGLKLLREDSAHTHLIRYEDLLSDPDIELDNIFRFCALPGDDKVHCYAREILHKPRKREACEISPVIEPVFRRIMHEFGYE